jgi:acyl-CoA synthetase (AMP-forming)/AMP-acid ligase II
MIPVRSIEPIFQKITERLSIHARRLHDKTFLVDLTSGRRYSFREFNGLVDRTCRYFEKLGLRPGDTAAAVLENSMEFCLLYFGALRSAIRFNPYPSIFAPGDVQRDTAAIRPKAVFLPEPRREEFRDLDAEKIFLPTGTPGAFIEGLEHFPPQFSEVAVTPSDVACLYCSSGRLVDPRGILYTHGNLAVLIPSVIRGLGLSEADVHLIVLPLAHTAALNYSLLPAAWLGATAVLARDFWTERGRFWRIVGEMNVTYVEVVPTVLYILLHQREMPDRPVAISHMACGSAPLSPILRNEFETAFGLPVADLYGLTETGPTHYDAVWSPGWKRGTIGRPLDCNEVAILDGEGRGTRPGEVGEIAVRGGNVFPGYAIHPGLTSSRFRDGWFLTGDQGMEDQEGYFHFKGRKKELIIRGGINIHPGEIDEVLRTHPDVIDSKTHGTPDDFFGELISTEVLLRGGSTATGAILKTFLGRRLSPIKIPDSIRIR